jgi:hypothetical protein
MTRLGVAFVLAGAFACGGPATGNPPEEFLPPAAMAGPPPGFGSAVITVAGRSSEGEMNGWDDSMERWAQLYTTTRSFVAGVEDVPSLDGPMDVTLPCSSLAVPDGGGCDACSFHFTEMRRVPTTDPPGKYWAFYFHGTLDACGETTSPIHASF